ncbi:hypothetical protein H4R19_001198 [Coemansia spiralis]|nr:hypothetical protein H4R19_001198 [Coemansia spiralis]
MHVVALLSLAALAAAKIIPRDADDVAHPRIIGGRPASASEFGSTAYMEMYDGKSGSLCTGSLIAPNVVLTAGHCVYKDQTNRYLASDFQVGITHSTPPPTELFKGISVTRVIPHPKFSMSDLVDDLALLILSESVPASTATPIKIYNGKFTTKTPIRAAGFGLTNPTDDTSVATQLMVVDLAIGGDAICKRNSNTYDPKTQICTDGTAGKDTCQGDSGGPLVTPVDNDVDFALLGLTSYGTSNAENPLGLCAARGSSGYYTYLAPYLSWIAQNANLDVKDIQVTNKTSSAGDSNDDEETTSASRSRSKSSSTSGSQTRTRSRTSGIKTATATDEEEDTKHEDTTSGATRIHLGLAAAGLVVSALLF